MKIQGGSFGVKGSAHISKDQQLVIEGAARGIYLPEQIQSVSANVIKEKKFGVFGFLVGAVMLSIMLGFFLNIIGVIIGFVVAVAGSFYSESKNIVEVKFTDEKTVALECTPRYVKKLIQFSPN